jgi:hypothetical protein
VRHILVWPALLLAAAAGVRAQEARGVILGRVVDSSGAVIPGVGVRITNQATGVAVTATTNEQGNYQAPYLIPGSYRIVAEARGFKTSVRSDIELRVDDRLNIEIALEVGDLAEQVTITAETPILETSNASLGQVIDAQRVAALPITRGNPYHLIQLSPGVAYAGDMKQDQEYSLAAPVAYAMDGTRSSRAEATVDGISVTFTNNPNEVMPAYTPPVDMTSEFKVQTATFDATVGQSEGGVINISLKSGTNDYHGTVNYVKMHPSLNANLFFANRNGQPRGDFNYDRWGGTLGGPVRIPRLYDGRNRTFIIFGYEALKESYPRGTVQTVPTNEQREGDFSALLPRGAVYQIYDPFTRRAEAGGRFRSDPLPGNIVPANRISPIARKILEYYPLPNTAGTADFRNNLSLPNEPEEVDYATYTMRVDHNPSERHRMFGRWNWGPRDQAGQNWFHNITTGQYTKMRGSGAAFDNVLIFGSSLVMNTRVGFARYVRDIASSEDGRGFDLTSLGLPRYLNDAISADFRYFPYITIGGYASTTNIGSLYRPVETLTLANSFDRMTGHHGLKFGMEYRVYRENEYNISNSMSAQFDFSSNYTRGPLDNSPAAPVGQSLASMLLGLPSGGQVLRRDSYAEVSSVWSMYFQDDWRITPRLTLTLGLRYELEGPLTERYNRSVRGFDPSYVHAIESQVRANYARNPTPEVPPERFNVRGGVTFAGVNAEPRSLWNRDTNNFMPRLGLAWQVGRSTVIRAGYGRFYGFLGARRGDIVASGFSISTPLTPTLDGINYRATLADPFPDGILEPPGASAGPLTNIGQSVTYFDPNPRAPLMQKWQFGIQRQLARQLMVELSYVGNIGNHIQTSRNWNVVPNEFYSTSPVRDQPRIDYMSANVPNPFYPLLPNTSRSGTNIGRSALFYPYPQFTSVNTTTSEGRSWYHSAQLRVERRFAQGFTVQGSYTWSKFMEATGFLNGADAEPSKVISDQDYPHRLTLSGIYELPVGRGRRFGANMSGPLNVLAGGWQVQAIFAGQSGQALGFGNMLFFGDLHDIPLPKGQRKPERWFNTDAGFEKLTARQLSWNLRQTSLRFTGVRGEGINKLDFSALKDTRMSEKFRLQFRAEFLNVLNHVIFGNPNTDPTSTAFGTVSSERGYPRRVQLGLKLLF